VLFFGLFTAPGSMVKTMAVTLNYKITHYMT